MTRYEINHEGSIIAHESALCSDLDIMLTSLFNQFGWNSEIVNKEGSCRRMLLTDANGKNREINVYSGTIRNESRNSYEKKIQLGTTSDPRLNDKEDTLIIGVYVFESNDGISDAIFVGYPIDDSIRYDTNPSIRGTFVNQILVDTKSNGFVYDKEHNLVGFLAPFIYYYLDNHYNLHYTTNKFPEVSYESIENKYENKIFPYNRIIFGAPGTGKSHTLEDDRKELLYGNRNADEKELDSSKYGSYERVTFHPDYSYANFVGTYKPVPKKNNSKNITYDYVPGPFMRVLVKALRDPNHDYLLIIEEINRANTAAVFGDVFQLLDRNESGESEYPIETSQDMRKFLAKGDQLGYELDKIYIPSNMFIWATMNSADQGVYPMDTAFKRRWDFEYIDIDANEDKIKDSKFKFCTGWNKDDKSYDYDDNQKNISWNKLRRKINTVLEKKCRLDEDKLLGPFFISKSNVLDKNDDDLFWKTFDNKVLMYLCDDALRHRGNYQDLFNAVDGYTHLSYAWIHKEFEKKGLKIFNFNENDLKDICVVESEN